VLLVALRAIIGVGDKLVKKFIKPKRDPMEVGDTMPSM
jgi:hypothetical protein